MNFNYIAGSGTITLDFKELIIASSLHLKIEKNRLTGQQRKSHFVFNLKAARRKHVVM